MFFRFATGGGPNKMRGSFTSFRMTASKGGGGHEEVVNREM
jgi:hypothetical protein